MFADGTRATRLTYSRDGDFIPLYHDDPTWSPDGRRIAFASQTEVYVLDTRGSALRRITRGYFGVGGIDTKSPRWWPTATAEDCAFIDALPIDPGVIE